MKNKGEKKVDWDTITYYILIVVGVSFAMYVLGITESIFLIGIAAIIGIVIGTVIIVFRKKL